MLLYRSESALLAFLPVELAPPNRMSDEAICWLRQEEDGTWIRIHEHDEAALDRPLACDSEVVPICGGRWSAHLAAGATSWSGVLRSRYDESKTVALTRSIWCYKSWPHGTWTPFVNADDTNLEAMWQMTQHAEVSAVGKGSGLVTLDGRHRVSLKRSADGTVSMSMKPLEASIQETVLEGHLSWAVERGWAGDVLPKLPADLVEYEELSPSALVLVVHGIGETLWNRQVGSCRMG